MASRYAGPDAPANAPLMPSQQSSFSGTLTALACQAAIAAIDAEFEGPSKICEEYMHSYSAPERSTPSSRTSAPSALMRWFPSTRIEGTADLSAAAPSERPEGAAEATTDSKGSEPAISAAS